MLDPVTVQIILLAFASSTIDELDSTILVQRIKSGDHKAFRFFFNEYYDSLLRFLINRNTPPEAAKDLIQKAFIYIWENRHNIDPKKSLRAYLYKIAYTRMLNHHRDNKKFVENDEMPDQENNLTPEDITLENDLKKAIDQAIDHMPEKRSAVFKLCFIDDFTYKEAAQTLDVSRKTIENHMGLALKDMRKALSKYK